MNDKEWITKKSASSSKGEKTRKNYFIEFEIETLIDDVKFHILMNERIVVLIIFHFFQIFRSIRHDILRYQNEGLELLSSGHEECQTVQEPTTTTSSQVRWSLFSESGVSFTCFFSAWFHQAYLRPILFQDHLEQILHPLPSQKSSNLQRWVKNATIYEENVNPEIIWKDLMEIDIFCICDFVQFLCACKRRRKLRPFFRVLNVFALYFWGFFLLVDFLCGIPLLNPLRQNL